MILLKNSLGFENEINFNDNLCGNLQKKHIFSVTAQNNYRVGRVIIHDKRNNL